MEGGTAKSGIVECRMADGRMVIGSMAEGRAVICSTEEYSEAASEAAALPSKLKGEL